MAKGGAQPSVIAMFFACWLKIRNWKMTPKIWHLQYFQEYPRTEPSPVWLEQDKKRALRRMGEEASDDHVLFLCLFLFFLFYLLWQMGEKTGGHVLFLSRLSILSMWSLRLTSRFQVPFNISSHFFFGVAIYRGLTPELALGKDEICWCAKYRKELLLGMLICQI